MLLFVAGVIVGAAIMILIGLYLVIKDAKPEAKPQGFAAVSIPNAKSGTTIETSIPPDLLRKVFKNVNDTGH